MESTGTNWMEIIKTIASCLIIVALFFTAKQIILAKRTILFNGFKSVYDDHFRIRKYFNKAVEQRAQLISRLESLQNIDEINLIYGEDIYAELREVGFHYEYVGILVKRKIVPLELCFDLLPFPDKFWLDSEKFVMMMRRKYLPDFWQNFEYLGEKYKFERTKDKLK